MIKPPIVFISYSHDSEDHLSWVLQLATRLRSNGVDVKLDRWDLKFGSSLTNFMDQGLSSSRRVLCICSDKYVQKANSGLGGVGYEKQIISSEFLSDTNKEWVLPVIRNNPSDKKLPTFLSGRLYLDFDNEEEYESNYESIIRDLLDFPLLERPPIGQNPFLKAKQGLEEKFFPGSEKYVSPSHKGEVKFNYSNNNGLYVLGEGHFFFEIWLSKSSDRNIQLINDPVSIKTVAIAKGARDFSDITDARIYDGSSRVRRPNIGEIAVVRNVNGFFMAIKIISIKDDTRGANADEIVFKYAIQVNGSYDFSNI